MCGIVLAVKPGIRGRRRRVRKEQGILMLLGHAGLRRRVGTGDGDRREHQAEVHAEIADRFVVQVADRTGAGVLLTADGACTKVVAVAAVEGFFGLGRSTNGFFEHRGGRLGAQGGRALGNGVRFRAFGWYGTDLSSSLAADFTGWLGVARRAPALGRPATREGLKRLARRHLGGVGVSSTRRRRSAFDVERVEAGIAEHAEPDHSSSSRRPSWRNEHGECVS